MNPLKSERLPRLTLRVLTCSTVPVLPAGWKTTVAGAPKRSRVPGRVSRTPAGTGTEDLACCPAGWPAAWAVCWADDTPEDRSGAGWATGFCSPEPQPVRISAAAAPPATSPAMRLARSTGSAAEQPLGEVGPHLVQADPLLLHRVALPDRDRVVLEGFEVDGHAVRRAYLVLAAVAATDRAGVVEVHVPADSAQLGGQVAGLRGQVGVARQRQHGDLPPRESRVEPA